MRETAGADEAPRWVWSGEVMELTDGEIARRGLSLGELARRAGARFAIDPESAERRPLEERPSVLSRKFVCGSRAHLPRGGTQTHRDTASIAVVEDAASR